MPYQPLKTLGFSAVKPVIAVAMRVSSAEAESFNLTVQGTEAIFLAGCTDATIPVLGTFFPELQ